MFVASFGLNEKFETNLECKKCGIVGLSKRFDTNLECKFKELG